MTVPTPQLIIKSGHVTASAGGGNPLKSGRTNCGPAGDGGVGGSDEG